MLDRVWPGVFRYPDQMMSCPPSVGGGVSDRGGRLMPQGSVLLRRVTMPFVLSVLILLGLAPGARRAQAQIRPALRRLQADERANLYVRASQPSPSGWDASE